MKVLLFLVFMTLCYSVGGSMLEFYHCFPNFAGASLFGFCMGAITIGGVVELIDQDLN